MSEWSAQITTADTLSVQSLEEAMNSLMRQRDRRNAPMPYEGPVVFVSGREYREICVPSYAFKALRKYRKDRRLTRWLGAASLAFSMTVSFAPERFKRRAERMRYWCYEELAKRGLVAGLFGNYRIHTNKEKKA